MPTTLIIVAAVAILIILLATASYKVCPADRVMVITGPGGRRFVSGGSAFIIPFIMRVDWLSLGAVQSLLRTDTPIPTKDAILIDVNAVANFQIASETMTVDENGKQVKALENAAKNYLNQSKERMEKDVTQVLLGKLREVIGRTELKALMENRDTFAATVAESARVDMERLGLQLTTFNIQDFTDRQNVIANMGAEMAAEISRNAKLASINAEQDVAHVLACKPQWATRERVMNAWENADEVGRYRLVKVMRDMPDSFINQAFKSDAYMALHDRLEKYREAVRQVLELGTMFSEDSEIRRKIWERAEREI